MQSVIQTLMMEAYEKVVPAFQAAYYKVTFLVQTTDLIYDSDNFIQSSSHIEKHSNHRHYLTKCCYL